MVVCFSILLISYRNESSHLSGGHLNSATFRSTVGVETLYGNQDDNRMLGGMNEDPENWAFAGWGNVSRLELQYEHDTLRSYSLIPFSEKDNDISKHSHSEKLGIIRSTSIAGNGRTLLLLVFTLITSGITRSCLYISGITIQTAGKFAPFSLLLVVIVLYFFRFIYSEVCEI